MKRSLRRGTFIILADLLIALFAFWLSRYFGDLPRWWWLVLASVIWVVIGVATGKLFFHKYKKLWYAFFMLLVVDVLTGGLMDMGFRQWVADYEYDHSMLLATGMIFVLECGLYHALYTLVYKKMAFFYEVNEEEYLRAEPIKMIENEEGRETEDVKRVLRTIRSEVKDPIGVVRGLLTEGTRVVNTNDQEALKAKEMKSAEMIVHEMILNRMGHINEMLANTNEALVDDGFVVLRCVTSSVRKQKFDQQLPRPLNRVMYFLFYVCHRVLPKLPLTKNVYFRLTGGQRRALTRVEVLGRLYRAGFDVVYEKIVGEELYVVARKIKAPIREDKPSNGVLIRLKRNGKDGKKIGVYKFRTMHAYSEYLQPYMYKTEGLAKDGGRYGNDYRVSKSGKVMRNVFVDELPMLINWVKGDLKLVGVRPLSDHYFSLYSKELQELRTRVKPGLLPPFYADKPQSLEEKQESEMRYLNAYLESPYRTDWKYFWRIFNNIVFKGTRSE